MGPFMRDCIDWGWATLPFDPSRAFRTPRSVLALIGPDPRVVNDDIWAKPLWAGLNLTDDDLPAHGHSRSRTGYEGKPWYPLEMVRAVALLWLFSGLRGNEISSAPVRGPHAVYGSRPATHSSLTSSRQRPTAAHTASNEPWTTSAPSADPSSPSA